LTFDAFALGNNYFAIAFILLIRTFMVSYYEIFFILAMLSMKAEAIMEYFQKNIETMPRKELKALQLERLKHIVNYAYDNVPHYKKKFDAAGVKPALIKSRKDI